MTLRAERVRWSAGGRLILDGISCAAPPGALVGLIGPNGSGKTSLLRCVAQLRRPDAGRVTLDGDDLGRLRRRRLARRLAFVEQDAPADLDMTVLDVVLLGRTPHRRALELDPPADRELAAGALRRCGLDGFAARSWQTLSGGERQRVRIARALVQEPDVLLLDEPTNHLDVAHQLDVLALVRELRVTTLAALHDLNLAALHCDRLVALSGGRVVAAGTPADVLTPALVRAVYDVDCRVTAHPTVAAPVVTLLPRPR